MALTLAQARAKVRARTRHVGDTVRLTDAALDIFLNDAYRQLRTELQAWSPTLYLCTTIDTAVTAGQTLELSSPDVTYEAVYRVERLNDDNDWEVVPRANAYKPSHHALGPAITTPVWERRAGYIYLQPEGEVYGTFRVLFYETPPDVTVAGTAFAIPVHLENALVYRAAAGVTLADGNDPAPFDKRAQDEIDRAQILLWREYGVHPDNSGFHSELGY